MHALMKRFSAGGIGFDAILHRIQLIHQTKQCAVWIQVDWQQVIHKPAKTANEHALALGLHAISFFLVQPGKRENVVSFRCLRKRLKRARDGLPLIL